MSSLSLYNPFFSSSSNLGWPTRLILPAADADAGLMPKALQKRALARVNSIENWSIVQTIDNCDQNRSDCNDGIGRISNLNRLLDYC